MGLVKLNGLYKTQQGGARRTRRRGKQSYSRYNISSPRTGTHEEDRTVDVPMKGGDWTGWNTAVSGVRNGKHVLAGHMPLDEIWEHGGIRLFISSIPIANEKACRAISITVSLVPSVA
jgi:hypothetical protein